MNNRQGNKKISLILVLKALEQMSDMAHPVSQIHLVRVLSKRARSLRQP